MAVYLYDDALTEKIRKWTEKTDLHIYPPDDVQRLIEVTASQNDDTIKLPILSISRVGGYEIINKNKRPLTYDGLMTCSDENKSTSLNAIPINITYQFDVWTRYMKEADVYMRSLIYNIINYPKLTVTLPYNSVVDTEDKKLTHNSNIRLISDVIDTSTNNRLSFGQFTRLSVRVSIDDAYLWDTRVRNNIKMFDDSDIVFEGE